MVVSSQQDTGRAINPIWFQAVVEQINRESWKTEAEALRARASCQPSACPATGPAKSLAPGKAANGSLVITAATFLVRVASFSPARVVHVTQGALQPPCRHESPGLLACTPKAAGAERGTSARPRLLLEHSCEGGAVSAWSPDSARLHSWYLPFSLYPSSPFAEVTGERCHVPLIASRVQSATLPSMACSKGLQAAKQHPHAETGWGRVWW